MGTTRRRKRQPVGVRTGHRGRPPAVGLPRVGTSAACRPQIGRRLLPWMGDVEVPAGDTRPASSSTTRARQSSGPFRSGVSSARLLRPPPPPMRPPGTSACARQAEDDGVGEGRAEPRQHPLLREGVSRTGHGISAGLSPRCAGTVRPAGQATAWRRRSGGEAPGRPPGARRGLHGPVVLHLLVAQLAVDPERDQPLDEEVGLQDRPAHGAGRHHRAEGPSPAVGGPEPGVAQDQPGDPMGTGACHGQPNRAAPGVLRSSCQRRTDTPRGGTRFLPP